jgi:hypothetical protein
VHVPGVRRAGGAPDAVGGRGWLCVRAESAQIVEGRAFDREDGKESVQENPRTRRRPQRE